MLSGLRHLTMLANNSHHNDPTPWYTVLGRVEGYEAWLPWAANCLSYFGFLKLGHHPTSHHPQYSGLRGGLGFMLTPNMLQVWLRRARTDYFGCACGVSIFLGWTGFSLCSVAAVMSYLAVCHTGEGCLFIHQNGYPVLRGFFIKREKSAFKVEGADDIFYSGHNFHIETTIEAAAARVPAHPFKLVGPLGVIGPSAMHYYTLRDTLTSISRESDFQLVQLPSWGYHFFSPFLHEAGPVLLKDCS